MRGICLLARCVIASLDRFLTVVYSSFYLVIGFSLRLCLLVQGYVKVQKNASYFSRYQVQFRRRRQCKTDYYARKRLVWMDKNKYNAPKYRLVVRYSNRDVICAIISSDVTGDRVVKVAYGHELTKYGVKFGFNSWPATYATALLLARRVNTHFKLPYLGSKEAVSSYFNVADGDVEDDSGSDVSERRPFKAVLDVGLHRTTIGARVFAAVKGACDGGLNIPHSPSRFVGTPKGKGADTDFEVVRKYIFGGHIAEYMNMLQEEDEDKFKAHFAVANKAGVKSDALEALWQSVHDKIRGESAEALVAKEASKLGYFKTRTAAKPASYPKKQWKRQALSLQQRKARIAVKLTIRDARIAAKLAEIAALENGSDSE